MSMKIILIFLAVTAACAQPIGTDASRPTTAKTKPEAYQLGPEDQILIRAANVPDISEKPLRLDANGYISMPMIGRVEAAGLTVEQLEAELVKRLKTYLENPEVAVSMVEVHTLPVSVIGEVGTPGVQQVRGSKSLVDILSMAGGVRPDAGPNALITRRLEYGRVPLPGAADDASGKFSVAAVSVKALMDGSNPEINIAVQPYDVISVPRAEFIFIMGEVAKAGPLPLSENQSMSILQAISSSGGVLKTAAPRNAKILRPIMGGPKRAELPVDIKRIMEGKANDLPLLAGDILLVPGSSSKKAGVRAIEVALQVGTMALTYGVMH
jgi:polysaccharide export outer membrane protein